MNPLKEDFHTHTTFSDGKNTPEEMIQEALERGMKALGFSDHSPILFDPDGGMKAGTEEDYIKKIGKLKELYRNQIAIRCGLEQDMFSPKVSLNFDYIIGSCHYLKVGDHVPFAIDNTPEILEENVDRYFSGDYLKTAECYYETVSDVVEVTDCDFIGHFDLITKYNEKYHLFDPENERYKNAWKKAADRLLKTKRPFEINTGGIYRGWKTKTYPDPEILQYLKQEGAQLFILSSDAHCREALMFGFEDALKWL